MRKLQRGKSGMTLLELMVTVSIMGVMVSVAIPAFKNYQLNSKRAEAYANLSALAKAEKTYYAEFGSFVEALAEPMGAGLGPDSDSHDSSSILNTFASVGWSPEGKVFYSYDVVTSASSGSTCGACNGGCFTASAYGDLDGDGASSVIMFAQPDPQGNFCNVWLMDTVSPPINNGSRVLNQVIRVDPFPGVDVDDY